MPRLEVFVGPDRFHLEPANVNQFARPNEIDGEHWQGRVLVRILDAPGAKKGEPGREYFKDRSRRFCIQIEGRFKKPWNGNEVLFGTDFDKLIDFPRAPFNAGMRVAKMIDPATFYDTSAPRPFIMSPQVACQNVLCAWPVPSKACDAVVVLRHTTQDSTPSPGISRTGTPAHFDPAKGPAKAAGIAGQQLDEDDDDDDIVPVEALSPRLPEDAAADKAKKRKSWFGFGGGHKEQRHLKRYWRFVGFKDDPRVRAFVEAHHASLNESAPLGVTSPTPEPGLDRSNSAVSTGSSTKAADVQQGHAASPTLHRLGTFSRKAGEAIANALHDDDHPTTPQLNGDQALSPDVDALTDAAEQQLSLQQGQEQKGSENNPMPNMPKLQRITTDARLEFESAARHDGIKPEDFSLAAEHLARARSRASNTRRAGAEREASTSSNTATEQVEGAPFESKLDEQLGPWRFADPAVDMVEDNAFVFTHSSYPVARRRKHFASAANREAFMFDPDVVYGSAFYSDAMNFLTFQVGLGPVSINIERFFKEMPIRYTLRGPDDVTFVTISFQLVDD